MWNLLFWYPFYPFWYYFQSLQILVYIPHKYLFFIIKTEKDTKKETFLRILPYFFIIHTCRRNYVFTQKSWEMFPFLYLFQFLWWKKSTYGEYKQVFGVYENSIKRGKKGTKRVNFTLYFLKSWKTFFQIFCIFSEIQISILPFLILFSFTPNTYLYSPQMLFFHHKNCKRYVKAPLLYLFFMKNRFFGQKSCLWRVFKAKKTIVWYFFKKYLYASWVLY